VKYTKKLFILLHIVAWLILFILPIYLISVGIERNMNFMARVYLRSIIYVLLFYINYFWLIPKFFFRNRKTLYFIILATVITLFFFLNEIGNRNIPYVEHDPKTREAFAYLMKEHKIPKPSHKFDIYNYLTTSLLISGFSIGLRMAGKYLDNEKQRKELEKERLNTELALLKNQVSPHFFFNTLNNIYSLIEINTQDAQKAVLQLSKLMRYLIYESEHGNTLLSREIDFMNHYIDLMKLRLNSKVKLDISFPEEYTDREIPPLLFVPLIENAFKHGVSYRENSFIEISMQAKPNVVAFSCRNSIAKKSDETISSDSGIGLENIRKRLSLLLPEKHKLIITNSELVFDVLLEIETNEIPKT
jgi:two-component system, LytTR family, sensor kinase